MTKPNIEQKAREVAERTGAVQSWHSKPCPACENNVAAIAAALQSAVAEEREECANEARCGNNGHDPSERIAAAIRARGQKETA